MEYRVYDSKTRKDITDQYRWVMTPDGKLYYMEYCDMIGYPNAVYISAEAAKELEVTRTRKKSRCHKCVYTYEMCHRQNLDNEGKCPNYKRDAPDGGYYG